MHRPHFITGSLATVVGATLLLPSLASAQTAAPPTVTPPPPTTTTVTTTQYQYYETPAAPPKVRVDKGPADRVQVGAQVGWRFGSSIDAPGGEVGLNGDWAYTGNVDVRLNPNTLLELTYTYMPTEVEFHPFVGFDSELTDLDIHYMQAGVQSEVPAGIARPFVGLALGAAYYNPQENIDSETYFLSTVMAGVKLNPSERVGVRFQASLPYTWTGSDAAVFCGFGGCDYAYVGDGILQLDLSAGAYAMF